MTRFSKKLNSKPFFFTLVQNIGMFFLRIYEREKTNNKKKKIKLNQKDNKN